MTDGERIDMVMNGLRLARSYDNGAEMIKAYRAMYPDVDAIDFQRACERVAVLIERSQC